VRLTDRFFLGEPQIRGFDIRGVGPRVKRTYFNTSTPETGDFLDQQDIDDALGGRAYYLGRLELEIPLGSGAREMGIRPSLFVDAGAVFGGKRPPTPGNPEPGTSRPILDESGNQQCYNPSTGELSPLPGTGCATGSQLYATTLPPFIEEYFGNSPKPRLSVGVGFNWNSPFGPFRIDIAKALLKQPGDDTKLFTFNVGTQF
jgi:outer membrane protein insertion porin family